MAPGHQFLVTLSLQPASSRTLWLQNKRACKSIVCTTQPVHCQKASPSQQPPSWKPDTTKTLGLIQPPSADLTSDDDQESLPFPRHNSGYVLTLSFLAAHRAAPSMKSAPRVCVPSPWSGETSVASTANWHPLNNVSPSATTSKRRPSEFCGGEMSISEHHVGRHSCTAFPAPPRTLSCPEPLICCTLLGGGASRRRPHRQERTEWEKQTETSEQQDSELFYLKPGHPVCWHSRERH